MKKGENMIIKKVWTTGKKQNFNYKVWVGWFLLGFVPIYIEQIKYQEN
jgi:hypothetical protein